MNVVPTRSDRIAIVGAGVAGLSCAAALAAVGCAVVLFDKGRRPGGRVASRRSGDAVFDHGAQFASARGAGFLAVLETLRAAGQVAPWPAAQRGAAIAWTGVPSMSALSRALADRAITAGATIQAERHVAWLYPGGRLRHLPAAEAKPGSTQDQGGETAGPFDAVLLALPAPQAAPLLATLDHPFRLLLDHVAIAPCWAVMAAYEDRLPGADVIRPDAGPLAWIARDSSRPGRPPVPDCWMLHASAAWSRAHLEDSAEAVTGALLAAFAESTGSTARPFQVAAHRWRHALVETPLGEACLWDAQARIGLCGDWCIGPRIEAAYDSGLALARCVTGAA